MLNSETWKDISGYEGIYKVSNYGNIKSVGRKVKNGKQTFKIVPETIRTVQVNNARHGYCEISLYKDGKEKRFRVHRLVAKHFIKNNDKKPEVNHKDGNKLNNNASNLEWVTSIENKTHAWESGFYKRKVPLEDYLFIYCLNKFHGIMQRDIAKQYGVWLSAIERVIREIRETKTYEEIADYYNSPVHKERINNYRRGINE